MAKGKLTVSYEEAKRIAEELEAAVHEAGQVIKALSDGNKTAVGLTSDAIKATSEWDAAKKAHSLAFSRLQDFNTAFVKTFKAEMQAERRNRKPKKAN